MLVANKTLKLTGAAIFGFPSFNTLGAGPGSLASSLAGERGLSKMPSLSWSDALRYLLIGFVTLLFYAFLDPSSAKSIVEKGGEVPLTGALLALGSLLYLPYRGLIYPQILWLKDVLGTAETNYRLWLKREFKQYRLSTSDAEFVYTRLRSKPVPETALGLQVTASGIHLMYMSAVLALLFAAWGSVSSGWVASVGFLGTAVFMAFVGFLSDRRLERFETSVLKEIPRDEITALVEREFSHRSPPFTKEEGNAMWREIKRASINRRLQELLKDIVAAELDHVPIQLYLPNLRCREIHFGGGFEALPLRIAATIENVGLARSRECGVQAQVWLSATGQSHVLAARCPALDPASSFRVELGSIANVAPNQFANATVIVDPPTAARPGGEVWESNEEDNVCWDGVYLSPAPVGEIPEEFPKPPGEPPPPEPPIRK